MRLKSQNWEKLEGSFTFHPINIVVFGALLTLKQVVDENKYTLKFDVLLD
jgi:hypothetical protein